jgi:hypothetical protein
MPGSTDPWPGKQKAIFVIVSSESKRIPR